MFKATPTVVFDSLVGHAMARSVCSYNDKQRLERAFRDGGPIPEVCRPGALLAKLSAEDREAISRLTSDQTRNYRPNPMAAYCT